MTLNQHDKNVSCRARTISNIGFATDALADIFYDMASNPNALGFRDRPDDILDEIGHVRQILEFLKGQIFEHLESD